MKTQIVNPNLSSFIKSLRDIGYSFEVAVADIIDNSITSKAKNIEIYTSPKPVLVFAILDDGCGMLPNELVEAMRLASKDPDADRAKNDLGRFGLGLKTASFSQCKRLTVVSKKDGVLSARLWDLEYISQKNAWVLQEPDDISMLPLFEKLNKSDSGTLVVWEDIDRYKSDTFYDHIDKLRKHLALVFHRFLEGADSFTRLQIIINNDAIKPFNPFNSAHVATQEVSVEKLKCFDYLINVRPYILPHHSKLTQQEYEYYATEDGYTKSQGFYLYRENRLLICGTWWGLHKTSDAYKLVRVRIDISNDQDKFWGIDIKKAIARPMPEIKSDLKRVISQASRKGSRPFTGRGRRIEDPNTTQLWNIMPFQNDFAFVLNLDYPLYQRLISTLSEEQKVKFDQYLSALRALLPLDAIQAKLHHSPHQIKQNVMLPEDAVLSLIEQIKSSGCTEEELEVLLKTDVFKNYKEQLLGK